MSNEQPGFNPYHKWLGISKDVLEPNHYQLLGLSIFESDPEVISSAADAQLGFLRTFQNGPHAEIAKKVLDEVGEARKCLLLEEFKVEYDEKLRQQIHSGTTETSAPATMAFPPGVSAKDVPEFQEEAAGTTESSESSEATESSESSDETQETQETEATPTADASAESTPAESAGEQPSSTPAADNPFAFFGISTETPAEPAAEGLAEEEAPKPKKKKGKKTPKSVKKTRANVRYTDRSFSDDTGEVINEKPVKVFRQIVMPIILVVLFLAAMFWLPYTARHKEALTLYERTLKHLEKNDLDKAKKLIDRAVELRPRQKDLEIYVECQKEVDRLIKERTESLRQKRWADEHYGKACALMDLKKWVEADREIDKALRAFPYEQQYIERKKMIAKKRGYTWKAPKAPKEEKPDSTEIAQEESSTETEETPAAEDMAVEETDFETQETSKSEATETESDGSFEFTAPVQTTKVKKEEKDDTAAKSASPKVNTTYDSKTKSGTKLVKKVGEVSFVFRFCKSGTFRMGSQDSETDDGYKRRPEYVDETPFVASLSQSYWILETEVTGDMWRAVMDAGQGGNLPMTNVSWDEAQTFCQRLGEKIGMDVKLPTEAQWEYACRAGTRRSYSGSRSSDLYALGWYLDNSDQAIHPVAQKEANSWGLFDMHGNVSEWCLDWCGSYPRITDTSVTDPTGAKSGSLRACRGGNFQNDESSCRSASRAGHEPNYKANNVGFRVVTY